MLGALVALAALAVHRAWGHQAGISYSDIAIEDGRVRYDLTITENHDLSEFDGDRDGALFYEEILERIPVLRHRFEPALLFSAGAAVSDHLAGLRPRSEWWDRLPLSQQVPGRDAYPRRLWIARVDGGPRTEPRHDPLPGWARSASLHVPIPGDAGRRVVLRGTLGPFFVLGVEEHGDRL